MRLGVRGMAESLAPVRWTIADLEGFPDDETKRYEIIAGELYVSRQPSDQHQIVGHEIGVALSNWNAQARLGVVIPAPGVIFSESDAVAPDLVWISHARRAAVEGEDHHLHGAPELVVEVLSPGAKNELRDRQIKLKLYSLYGVQEYWIVDWRSQTIAVYRRRRARLRLITTLGQDDILASPLLPGFALPVHTLFEWL
jgi:Uma2 family endonuclease